jgi:hypothetical protein
MNIKKTYLIYSLFIILILEYFSMIINHLPNYDMFWYPFLQNIGYINLLLTLYFHSYRLGFCLKKKLSTLVGMASTPLRNASTALVRVGGAVPIVALAEQSDTQRVFNGTFKNAIPIVSEQINFEIGNENVSDFQTPGRILLRIPPVVIPSGGCAMFNIWGPAQTAAPTYEGILYYIEE